MEKFVLIFRALSDRTRLRIINLLISSGLELCVCEIVDSLEEPQYKISKHLKELKFAGLVEEKKQGKWVTYALAAPKGQFKKLLFRAIISIPDETLARDEKRLRARLSLRQNGQCIIGLESREWETAVKQLEREKERRL